MRDNILVASMILCKQALEDFNEQLATDTQIRN